MPYGRSWNLCNHPTQEVQPMKLPDLKFPARLHHWRIFTVSLCLLTASTASAVDRTQDDYLKLVRQALQLIQPAHQQFADQALQLQQQLNTLCDAPSADQLAVSQNVWRDTMAKWMQVSVLQFGPLQENDRRLRIQAWPMRNRLLMQGIKQLSSGSEAPTLQTIAEGSVATQGLPAIEVFLFRENALDQLSEGYSCAALTAISAHLVKLAGDLNQRWQHDFGLDFGDPASHPGGFDQPEQAFDELLNGLVTAVQQIKRRKLEEPLGFAGKTAKANTTESFLSQNSTANLQHNLQAIVLYLKGGDGYGIDDDLSTLDSEGLAILILDDRLKGLERLSQQLQMPLESLLTPADAQAESQRELAEATFKELSLLNNAFENQIFSAMGVTRDFNSEDGD